MSSTNQQTGWIFVWIVCLFPIVLWFFAPASVPRFNSIPSTLLSISKLAALVGTSMFALTLFLSARIKIFEKFFNGLNQVYERQSTWANSNDFVNVSSFINAATIYK